MNKSKPGSNGSNRNAILIFLIFTSSFFHLLIKKTLMLESKLSRQQFFPYWKLFKTSSTSQTSSWDQCLQQITIFTIELISKFESLYTSHLHLQSVFLSVSQLMYRNSYAYYPLLLLLSGDISLHPGSFHNLQPLDYDKCNIFKQGTTFSSPQYQHFVAENWET